MSDPRPTIAALVPVFDPALAREPFAGTTVLGATLARLARCQRLDTLAVLTNAGVKLEIPAALNKRVRVIEAESLEDAMRPYRMAARKWSPTCWRGGLGGATCYDEALAPAAMLEAMGGLGATAALIVGADWVLVDPRLCDAVIDRHVSLPQTLKLVFTQAPPGLSGCVITADVLTELRDKGAMIGSILDYQPRVPQGDPIGKDTCVQVEAAVRSASVRGVFDAARWRRALRAIEARVEETTGAAGVVELLAPLAAGVHEHRPQQVTLELTTRRKTQGPAVAAGQVDAGRGELTLEAARRLFAELSGEGDVVVTLGGLGDPLLHGQWAEVVGAAREAGIAGVHIQTDLLVEEAELAKLLESGVDVVSVHVNADTAQTYRRVMGADGLGVVIKNLEWLLNHRRGAGRPGLPWIVPRFAKTAENVHELELFFDRWVYFCGHAIVESPQALCGAVGDVSVMDMSPPRRRVCRQLGQRLSVQSDGGVAMCDQDVRGGLGVGVGAAWGEIVARRGRQERGVYEGICGGCRAWHRP